MRPMLASPGDRVPDGAQWAHEVKWDGMRILADVGAAAGGTGARLTSRNENDVTPGWPDVATSPLGTRDLLVDGEVIALDAAGLPSFRTLQERMHVRRATDVRRLVNTCPVTYMVFDLLRLDGRDLREQPLERRRERLVALLDGSTGHGWAVPASYDDGAMLLEATRTQGLEGVVSKRRDSRYRPGERSPQWLKFPHRFRGTFVVGGWRPQEGTTHRLASLLVGLPGPEGLVFRGRVGSGIGGRLSTQLGELVAGLERSSSPFRSVPGEVHGVPRADALGTTWTEPVLVVEVESLGRGHDRLRQPTFQGVRTDVEPGDLGEGS